MLQGTIRNDDFLRNTATLLRHCFEWLQHCFNIATLYALHSRQSPTGSLNVLVDYSAGMNFKDSLLYSSICEDLIVKKI